MIELWQKIAEFFKGLISGKTRLPPEIESSQYNLLEFYDIYRCKAPWLKYDYVTSDGQKRTRRRLTLNPAKIACSELAGLVLAEVPEVQAGDLVESVLTNERFFDNLRKAIEYQAAFGGQAIKAYVTSDRRIKIDFVKAPNFIPLEWDNAQVIEGSFIDRRKKNGKSYIRVETHRIAENGKYEVENKAFDELTKKEVLLSVIADWAKIEPIMPIDSTVPMFVYITNPEANNIDPESPLGISLFANAIDTIQALDLAFDGMKTEILTGRQRVAIPAIMMRKYKDPEDGKMKTGFDPTDEAYIKLEGDDASKMTPTDLSGQLRMEQWRLAIQTLLDIYAVQIGYNAGYFSFDGTSMKTATEVISENSKTFKTMQAYRENIDFGLKQLFRMINELGRIYQIQGFTADEPNIIWDDSVIDDRQSRYNYYSQMVGSKLIDRITALMRVHGIDEEAAIEMNEKIKKETQVAIDQSIFGA